MHRLHAVSQFRQQIRPILVLCALLSLLTACGNEESVPVQSVLDTYLQDAEAISRGQSIFEGSCASYCHGDEPKPGEDVDLFDCQWKYGGSNEEIFTIVTSGIPETRMVGFGNNFPGGQDDLWKLIAYLRTEQQSCTQLD